MARYNVETNTIEQLFTFSSHHFNIPAFQRPYTWTEKQVSKLVSDLFGKHRAESYFLGSIILSEEDEGFYVLDGQQRLVTISLVLAVLKDRLEKQGHANAKELVSFLMGGKFGRKKKSQVQLQPKDQAIYEMLITHPTPKGADKNKQHALANALMTINKMIDDYAKLAEKNHIRLIDTYQSMVTTLMYKVELIKIVAPSKSAAFQLLEMLNDKKLAFRKS